MLIHHLILYRTILWHNDWIVDLSYDYHLHGNIVLDMTNNRRKIRYSKVGIVGKIASLHVLFSKTICQFECCNSTVSL